MSGVAELSWNETFVLFPSCLEAHVFPSFWPRRAAIQRPGSTWLAILAGVLSGFLLPFGILWIGWTIELLVECVIGNVPPSVKVGLLALPTEWLGAGNSAVRAVSAMLVILAGIFFIKYLAVSVTQLAAHYSAFDFDVQVQKRLFEKSAALATVDGLSVQRSALHEIQSDSVPKVRESIAAWYMASPRYMLRVLLLTALAASIHPWLTATAVVGLFVLRTFYSYVESSVRKRREAHWEQWRTSRERLSYLCDTAPLLATIHNSEDTAQEFQSLLQTYRHASMKLLDFSGWKSPTVRLISTMLALILGILVSIRVFAGPSIGLGGATVLCTSVAIAVYSLSQIRAAYASRRTAEGSLQQIVSYLCQPQPTENRSDLRNPSRVEKELVFDHLMLRESNGKKLLEDVSVTLRRGQMTALISDDRFSARALAELCLGFGKPTSGRMLIDDNDSNDISRIALQRLALWVAPNGPLLSGSITENLWINEQPDATFDLMDAARKARVADAILNLPEGLQTLVSPVEGRLPPDAMFRIGLTRGFVKKPSIIVAEEPGPGQGAIEAESTDALMQLRNDGFIVVVLASRLSTLRSADQIVLLHEHRVQDIGTHTDLLDRSELYRHLNYVRFTRF
jgi:ATP-binding cassette subfamily B protein